MNLIIRPIIKSDILELLTFRNSESFIKYCSHRKNTVTQLEFINEITYDFQHDRFEQFLVIFENEAIGTLWVYGLHRENKYAFVTTYLKDGFTKRGYGIFTFSRVLQYLFEDIGLYKVYMDVYVENNLSVNTLTKRDVKLEATFVGHRLYNGVRLDMLRFAIFSYDLQKVKEYAKYCSLIGDPKLL